jgi:hypothetical protein
VRFAFSNLAVFESATAAGVLDRLAIFIGDARHNWVDPDPAYLSDFLRANQQEKHLELLTKSWMEAAAYGETTLPTVVIIGVDDTPDAAKLRLPLEAAASFLSQPLEVYVENQLNDGRAFVRIFSTIDADLVEKIESPFPPMKISNGGGREAMLSLVTDLARKGLAKGVPARIIAITDSDCRFPGDKSAETGFERGARLTGVNLIRLRKRSIENYVPDSCLEQLRIAKPETSKSIEFVLSLTPLQRDHFPLKKGIPDTDRFHEGEHSLYEGVTFPSPPGLSGLIEFFVKSEQPTLNDYEMRYVVDEFTHLASEIRKAL